MKSSPLVSATGMFCSGFRADSLDYQNAGVGAASPPSRYDAFAAASGHFTSARSEALRDTGFWFRSEAGV